MAIPQEIKDRIFGAADELYTAAETGEYPSVEAVRQRSRASMNYVVEALKEWRQRQRVMAQTVREPLPDTLHAAVLQMGQGLWATAQQLANDSLDAAKAAFESEKADLAKLSAEQSEAFEGLTVERDKLLNEFKQLEAKFAESKTANEALGDELRQVTKALNAAETSANEKEEMIRRLEGYVAKERAAFESQRQMREAMERDVQIARAMAAEYKDRTERAEAKAKEMEHRLTVDVSKLTEQLADERRQLSKADAERDVANRAAEVAREAAARVQGEVEAMKSQNAALMDKFERLFEMFQKGKEPKK